MNNAADLIDAYDTASRALWRAEEGERLYPDVLGPDLRGIAVVDALMGDAEHVHLARQPDGTSTATPMVGVDRSQAYISFAVCAHKMYVKYVYGDCLHPSHEDGRWQPEEYHYPLWVDEVQA